MILDLWGILSGSFIHVLANFEFLLHRCKPMVLKAPTLSPKRYTRTFESPMRLSLNVGAHAGRQLSIRATSFAAISVSANSSALAFILVSSIFSQTLLSQGRTSPVSKSRLDDPIRRFRNDATESECLSGRCCRSTAKINFHDHHGR